MMPKRVMSRSRLRAAAAAASLGAAALFGVPAALAHDNVPIGIYNVNNQVMNNTNFASPYTSDYLYAIRFVPKKSMEVARFISGFNVEGAVGVNRCPVNNVCRPGYAHGNGGTIRAWLVSVNPDGTPNLGDVHGQDTVNAVTRWSQSLNDYQIPGADSLLFFNMNSWVTAGRMYAMVYHNDDPSPDQNWFSENSPVVKESEAGPNATNTLDPNATGAVAGLDPREAVAWSTDNGATWAWGRAVGQCAVLGLPLCYAGWPNGSPGTLDNGTRLPWYGLQSPTETKAEPSQPYYGYAETDADLSGCRQPCAKYTLDVKNTLATSLTLTEAGGYAPAANGSTPAATVGVVTVTNTTTRQSAQTTSLGTGIAEGPLSRSVAVIPGQTYTITHSGAGTAVILEELDSFGLSVFGIGAGWPIQTEGYPNYARANLFAQ